MDPEILKIDDIDDLDNQIILHANDVVCGRGGPAIDHIGNLVFRELVERNKLLYAATSNQDKINVSKSIMKAIKSQNPPGRFLLKDTKTGHWSTVSEDYSLRKTSQALREGAIKRRINETPGYNNRNGESVSQQLTNIHKSNNGTYLNANSMSLYHHTMLEQDNMSHEVEPIPVNDSFELDTNLPFDCLENLLNDKCSK